MDENNEAGGRDEKAEKNQNQTEAGGGGASKRKSCKGCLYYSSILKSKGINPRCIGIPRTLHQVEASIEGRTLAGFYYACAGYSVYISKDHSTDNQKQVTKTELPVCVGFEFLAYRRAATSDNASAPAHAHGREDGLEIHQPRTPKPTHSAGDDFLSRYTRNANLVASGVARNMRKVGNYIKENVDDILYPYRKRPK
ncbi:uncharacterized protein LOC110609782 isoform X2 [Manihot esculenta]|uniref:uncharacterized protein LOC110609782 isoform X2 n=1 Tax=Manihot esculenta TaxID=3983 RepID=UPI001CC7823D|nr:uncharacterized protein LOC110609782 isoform X2 [Manihot esculenta]